VKSRAATPPSEAKHLGKLLQNRDTAVELAAGAAYRATPFRFAGRDVHLGAGRTAALEQRGAGVELPPTKRPYCGKVTDDRLPNNGEAGVLSSADPDIR
jgi:hypothetical protein